MDFVVGDFVYAILTNDHSLVHEYNKLVARKIGPPEIIEKINQNAYHLQFSSHIHVVHVFNVKHLIPYFGDVFFFFVFSCDDMVSDLRMNLFHFGEDYAV